MSEYLVSWSVHIEANSAKEAAEKANQDYFLTGHMATVFEVTDTDELTLTFDLPVRHE